MSKEKTAYFWYSQQYEEDRLFQFVLRLESGTATAKEQPRIQRCRVLIQGSETEVEFSIMVESTDQNLFGHAYPDVVCLGAGEVTVYRPMKLADMAERMRSFGMFVPPVLSQ